MTGPPDRLQAADGPQGFAIGCKHLMDKILAVSLLVVASPLLLLLALLIRMTMGSPVLFRHRRPGYLEVPFDVLKFRTMRSPDASDAAPWFRTDERRLTPLGRFLRKSSLDELPQLFNVLRGEMSLVGPRPLLLEYLPKYTTVQRRRHAVRPGITGLAAAYGRQNLPFSKRLELDLEYVRNWSLALDLRIALRTIGTVFTGRDVVLNQDIDEVDDLGFAPDRDDSGEAE